MAFASTPIPSCPGNSSTKSALRVEEEMMKMYVYRTEHLLSLQCHWSESSDLDCTTYINFASMQSRSGLAYEYATPPFGFDLILGM